MKKNKNVAEVLDDLRKRGYDSDFETQTFCLYCSDLDMRLNPEEFHIDESYRLEDDPGPGENTIVYAISTAEGIKGILTDSYASYTDHLNVEMGNKLLDRYIIVRK
jgi:hypothetical protein